MYNKNLKQLKFPINPLNIKMREVVIEKAKINENYTMKINDKYIHSKYDPHNEAKRFVDKNIGEKQKILLSGFGMGYVVEEFLRRGVQIKVIVLNPDVFLKTLSIRDLEYILLSEKVEIIFGETYRKLIMELNNKMEELIDYEHLIYHPALKLMDESFCNLRDIIEEIDINRKSYIFHKDIINKNIENNFNDILKCVGVDEFRNIYFGKPIFIVAAGPSLNRNIQKLKDIKDTGIIISVGTALRALIKNEIIPDFIVAIDGLDNIYDQIAEYSDLNIPLLFLPGVNSKMLVNYNKYKIVAFTDKDTKYENVDRLLNKGKLQSGGSVAHVSLDFANKLGGNPLILVGQDLALNNEGETHADNTARENDKVSRYYKKVLGIDGKEVPTLKNLYFYLKWFEKYINDNREKKFIDATEGGAKINGTVIKTLCDTINEYCNNNIDKSIFIEKIENYKFKLEDETKEAIKKLIL